MKEGLHLKSILTALDWETILIVDTEHGHIVEEFISTTFGRTFKFVRVPDLVAANIIRIGNSVLVSKYSSINVDRLKLNIQKALKSSKTPVRREI